LVGLLLGGNPTEDHLVTDSPLALFDEFVKLVVRLGMSSTVVTIDKVDETQLALINEELVADSLKPLLSHLGILELPHAAFKFFLPQFVIKRLGTTLRTDRIATRTIAWDDAGLTSLLERRLAAFSDGRVSTLREITDHSYSEQIMPDLLKHSGQRPRDMLRLMDLVVAEQCELGQADARIGSIAFERAVQHFRTIRTGELDGDEYVRRIQARAATLPGHPPGQPT
jgi:hypothetical protein